MTFLFPFSHQDAYSGVSPQHHHTQEQLDLGEENQYEPHASFHKDVLSFVRYVTVLGDDSQNQ
jgi:hypothetical protein